MKNRDLISGLFWMGIGIVFCGGAIKYGIMSSGIPGPGFFPFFSGFILIILSLLVWIPAIKVETRKWHKTTEEKFFPEKESIKKILLALIGLCIYGFLLQYLGFLVVTCLLMIFLLIFVVRVSWITILTMSILAPGLSFIILELVLKIYLPKGIFGF
jgi:uncharacterized membrane protein YhaH (DUF805 family)